ncbi:hypothetical protein [Lysinibacillus sp. K60]|uniref:hypothetical protein n=1 Tax=Lysinibacillus sp. K60 TaxID=2720027 RepID=UPI001C8B5FAF|nr:hypothetical protein [Lysinibacillus sp. K60]MBX8943460.1 hypothetical protein [Lysinibacillus sp. K60]
MNKKNLLIKSYITQKLASYKNFMLTEKTPEFQLIIDEAKVFASHNYDVKNDRHSLLVGPDIVNMEAILFHEFTHMYDVIRFSTKDSISYAQNRGYTEYHAAQIELLKLLNAKNIEDKLTFSLQQSIKTPFGEITVLDYILKCVEEVRELILKEIYPDNLYELSNTLGIIFNYLGRISICQLYADDYDHFKEKLEELDFALSFLGENSSIIISMTKGFLSDKEVKDLGEIYFPMVIELINKYKIQL